MRRPIIVAWCALLIAVPAAAQVLPASASAKLSDYAKSRLPIDLDGASGPDVVAAYILQRVDQDRGSLSGLRADLEFGSLAATGATSLLARPSVTDILSAAFESGAVVRKADDKAMTLTFNALALKQLMAGQRPVGCGSTDRACEVGAGRWLRGLSGSVTFSTSKPVRPVEGVLNNGALVFLTGGRSVQGYAARYELFTRERSTSGQKQGLDAAAAALSGKAGALLSAEEPFERRVDALITPAWYVETQAALKQVVTDHSGETPDDLTPRLERVLLERLEAAYAMAHADPEVAGLIAKAAPEREAYIAAMNAVLAEKLYRKAFTIDYANARPTDQPIFHELRLVASVPLGHRNAPGTDRRNVVPSGTFTANAGISMFKPGVDGSQAFKVRHTQVSVGFDWSPPAWGLKRPVYTIAYYFQYMHEDGVLKLNGDAITPGGAKIPLSGPAKTILNTKGAIHVVQLRVSVPAGNGVRFPAAVSWANRTELITGRPFWQGHIGVSYDFSALKGLTKNDGK